VDRQTRARLRGDYQVTVRVRCDRCARVLGELHGNRIAGGELEPLEFSSRTMTGISGILPRGGRIDYFRCVSRCGARYAVRWDRLVAAYQAKAARPVERERVVWLLADVRG